MKGHIAPLGPNKWRVFYDVPPGPDGKRQLRSKRVTGSKKDAEVELRKLLSEVDKGTYARDATLTVGIYLQRWLKDYAKNRVAAKTFERYEEIVHRHLIPNLGRIALAKLRPDKIATYYTEAQETGKLNGRGGLSAQTVLHHHRILRKALAQAVRWELIPANPVAACDPPRALPPDKTIIDEAQVRALFEAARGTDYYTAVVLGLATGMRRGEVCGLRWQDVDLENGKLTVMQSLEQTRTGMRFKPPKTRAARRIIDLSPSIVRELQRQKGMQAQHKLLLGNTYKDMGLVVTRPSGEPVQPDSLTQWFSNTARRLELPITLHGLRHTHASQLMLDGIHPKVVSERLGHSKVAFTLDTYSHLVPSQQRDAADRMEGHLRRVIGE